MKKLFNDWDKLLAYEKIFRVLTMVFAVATMVLAFMSLCDAADMAIMQLSMGLMNLCQGIYFWRQHKGIAISSLCVSAFVLLVVIFIAIL